VLLLLPPASNSAARQLRTDRSGERRDDEPDVHDREQNDRIDQEAASDDGPLRCSAENLAPRMIVTESTRPVLLANWSARGAGSVIVFSVFAGGRERRPRAVESCGRRRSLTSGAHSLPDRRSRSARRADLSPELRVATSSLSPSSSRSPAPAREDRCSSAPPRAACSYVVGDPDVLQVQHPLRRPLRCGAAPEAGRILAPYAGTSPEGDS
jgi:hypothetical protein